MGAGAAAAGACSAVLFTSLASSAAKARLPGTCLVVLPRRVALSISTTEEAAMAMSNMPTIADLCAGNLR
jgi:hypothetical protein